LGRQVDGRTGPRRARGDLDLVLGLSGEDHRHAVLQRLLNPTVTAVADQNARAGQQFGEGDELGDPRIGRDVSQLSVTSEGRDDQDVEVRERFERWLDQLGEVVVRSGARSSARCPHTTG
jgi:hypothetical protein